MSLWKVILLIGIGVPCFIAWLAFTGNMAQRSRTDVGFWGWTAVYVAGSLIAFAVLIDSVGVAPWK